MVRAHLIDRWSGGLDTLANLVPLCEACHAAQPIFTPGDEPVAFAWAYAGLHDALEPFADGFLALLGYRTREDRERWVADWLADRRVAA